MGTSGAARRNLFTWAVGVSGLAFAIVSLVSSRVFHSDTFYDLVAGREIVRHGFSQHDPWTFLGHGRRWIDQQWLAHLAYYGSQRLWGFHGVAVLSASMVAIGFGVLAALTASRGGAPIRVAIWLAAALVVAEVNSFVRAQSFAYVTFAVALTLLVVDHDRRVEARRTTALRVGLVVTLLVWGNLHGSVIGFLPVLVTAWAWQAWRLRMSARGVLFQIVWTAVACIAPLVTPFGVDIVRYYRGVLDNPELQAAISEWQPAKITASYEWIFFLLLAASVVVSAIAVRRRVAVHPVLAIGAAWFAVAGLDALRSQVWFAFFAAPFLVDTLTRLDASRQVTSASTGRSSPRGGQFAVAAAAFVAMTAVACGVVGQATTSTAHYYGRLPVNAIDRIPVLVGASGRACADEDGATPLEWRHPQMRGRVAFDARFEMYSQEQLHGIFELLTDQRPTIPEWVSSCDVLIASSDSVQFRHTIRRLPGVHVVIDDSRGLLVSQRRRPSSS